MPLVTWNDFLIINIPGRDRQYKQFIDQLNTLVDTMLANCRKEEIKGILYLLDFYIAQNFGLEKNFMQRYKYPVGSNNAATHTKFIKTLSEVKQNLPTKGSSLWLAIKVNEELLDWFVNHIKKVDRELNSCMSKP